MTIFESFILGIVQGLTEFIPVSSSAHLRVVPALLGWHDPGAAYSAVIQLGSICAVFSYFRHDLWSISTGAYNALKQSNWQDHNLRILGGIIIGTIPICVLGLLFKHMIEDESGPFRSLVVIGITSICMGLFLLLAEILGKRQKEIKDIGAKDGFFVGLGQVLALIPGASRSGTTITMSLLLNMKREDAARFSFLLGIPAITLAGLLELKDMVGAGLPEDGVVCLLVGLITSLIVSYLSIAWLLKYLKRHSTWLFICYRIIFGISIVILVGQNLIH